MADDNDDLPDDPKVTRLPRNPSAPRPHVEAVPADLRQQRASMMLGPECPYVPLGHDDGTYYVLDRNLTVRRLVPRDLSRNVMVSLAGEPWLEKRYPRTRKKKSGADFEVYGLAAEKAAAELMDACSIMGFWNPDEHVRGVGGWSGADGDLVLHRGDHLWIRNRVAPLGLHSGSVYVPRRPLAPLPTAERSRPLVKTAAEGITARLDTFRWARSTYDTDLIVGWICCAMLGAALAWRPHLWLTGDWGSGKSTLQYAMAAIFGTGGIVSVTDASAAGLWQHLKHDTVPIGIDEQEPSARDDTKQEAMVKLLRQASSSALILRGGGNHSGSAFSVQSCFLCSSIDAPRLQVQDVSRIVTIGLLKDVSGVAYRAPFSLDQLTQLGAALARRLADHYQRLVRDVQPAVRRMMIEGGLGERIADVYAALWAARDVAMFDELAPERVQQWLDHRFTLEMRERVALELSPGWRRCLDFLLTSKPDFRSEDTAGDWIARGAIGLQRPGLVQPSLFFNDEGEEVAPADNDRDGAAARNRLLRYGLHVRKVMLHGTQQVVLAVANQHRALGDIFAPTIWRSQPDAVTSGWSETLRKAPEAQISGGAIRFRALRARAVLLPIDLVLGTDERPAAGVTAGEAAMEEELPRPAGEPLH